MTYLGDTWIAVGTVVLLALVLTEEYGPRLGLLVPAVGGVTVAVEILSRILGPTSPEYGGAAGINLGPGHNYPSGHAAYALSVFGLVAWIAWTRGHRALAGALALPAVLMGPALALLGDHYPADIVAGWALGGAWLIAIRPAQRSRAIARAAQADAAAGRPMPQLEGVEHRWVQAGRVRLHIAEAGDAKAPALLLVHGWPSHWWCWRGVMSTLAEHRRVIAVDLPGFGWSDVPTRGYDKARLADDLAALLDALDVADIDVLAHDWGGVIGFHLCLRHPERVRRYVALNTGHLWMPASWKVIRNLPRLYLYQSLMMAPVLWRSGPRWVAAAIAALAESTRTYRRADSATFTSQFTEIERNRATRDLYRSFMGSEWPAMLAGAHRSSPLRTPTLFLHGAADPVITHKYVEDFDGRADDYRFELLPGLGHFPQEEDPDLIARRALAFLVKTARGSVDRASSRKAASAPGPCLLPEGSGPRSEDRRQRSRNAQAGSPPAGHFS